jgi:hypothetical protein
MSVPRKKPYPAPRSLIVLGKITNQGGIRKAVGMSTTRGVKHGAPAAHECGRRVMTGYRNWDRGSRRCAGSVTTTSESSSRLRVFNLDITRDHNHDGLRLALLVFEQGVESGSVRQIDVLRHRRGPFRVEGLQRRGHRRGFERVLPQARSASVNV